MTEVVISQERRHSGDTSMFSGNIVPQALDSLRKVQHNCELLLAGRDDRSCTSSRDTASQETKQLITETMADLEMCVSYLESAVHPDVCVDNFPASLKDSSYVTVGRTTSLQEKVRPICLADLNLTNSDLTMSILNQPDRWAVDLFKVEELSDNRALTCVMFMLMNERNYFSMFEMESKKFLTFMRCLQASYRQLPFHCATHAADVVLTSSVFLNSQLLRDCFTDLEVLSVLIGCAIHDVGHPGYTNMFMANSGSDISLVYGTSCLERYHLARGLALLQQPTCNILSNLSPEDRKTAKELIRSTILATDNDIHKEVMAEMSTVCNKISANRAKKLQVSVKTLTPSDRLALLRGIIHTADLSNPAKPFLLYDNWCQRVMTEFFRQGDREKALGISVSPICDRETTGVSQAQVPFITYLVSPLFDVWFSLPLDEIMKAKEFLRDNCKYHENRIKKDEVSPN